MIVFQTPTHPVIISNLGWCFFVENSVETFKDVAKVEHLWKKKEKTILENLSQQSFGFCQRKKNKPLFSKRFVSNILCPKKQKELWKLLVQKASVDSFGLQKEKEKQGF